MSFHFRPADSINERFGLFIALVGGTNSGKTFSALRLARGIAGESGKVAVLDTEGGRTLHLKDHFRFDANIMDAPFRPERFAEAAKAAEDAGYDVLLIDSFSAEWAGLGGVLDWQSDELERAVERQRANAAQKGWSFSEDKARNANKLASWIEPKMGHKAMVYSLLQRRIPIIFSIRGESSINGETKKEDFRLVCDKRFPFEVTVSFRLAADRKGVIDLSDPAAWKMEGAHRDIFRDGERLSERHGDALRAWAAGGQAQPQASKRAPPTDAAQSAKSSGLTLATPSGPMQCERAWQWLEGLGEWLKAGDEDAAQTWRLNAAMFQRIQTAAEQRGDGDTVALCLALEQVANSINERR
ncbi:ATP-binding protein [Novispirillum sp. DQ9]|uniref:ATP-binding protein n=1 Tax=Novispirillum sp. DQ9 TaxID=3398612 RepID=UPI003C7A1EA7